MSELKNIFVGSLIMISGAAWAQVITKNETPNWPSVKVNETKMAQQPQVASTIVPFIAASPGNNLNSNQEPTAAPPISPSVNSTITDQSVKTPSVEKVKQAIKEADSLPTIDSGRGQSNNKVTFLQDEPKISTMNNSNQDWNKTTLNEITQKGRDETLKKYKEFLNK